MWKKNFGSRNFPPAPPHPFLYGPGLVIAKLHSVQHQAD